MNKDFLRKLIPANQIVLNDLIVNFFPSNLKFNRSDYLTMLILFGSRFRGDVVEHFDGSKKFIYDPRLS